MAKSTARKLTWRGKSIDFIFDNAGLTTCFSGPEPVPAEEIRQKVEDFFHQPSGNMLFALKDLIVGGDQVVIPVVGEFGQIIEPLQVIISKLKSLGIAETDITVLCHTELQSHFNEHFGEGLKIILHNPEKEEDRAYLASTSDESRIYLNRQLLDHDIVIPLIVAEPASSAAAMGYLSLIWPYFSDNQTITSVRAKYKKSPDSMRRTIREAIWLSGMHLVIAAIPARTGIASIEIFQPVSMQPELNKQLNLKWQCIIPEAINNTLMVAGFSEESELSESSITQFFKTVSRVASRIRKLAVVVDFPDAFIKKLGELTEKERASSGWFRFLGKSASSCSVYMLSNLPEEWTEELDVITLESPAELDRLVKANPGWAMIDHAEKARIVFE